MIETTSGGKTRDHEWFMHRCIKLAQLAKQRGDSPVGAIVVLEGQIVGEGMEGAKTRKDITFHAEIEAIRRAREVCENHDLSRCVLYTTHEPCIMCSYVIRQAQIHMVVMSVASDEIGGFSSRFPLLTDSSIKKWTRPPELIIGIAKDQCAAL